MDPKVSIRKIHLNKLLKAFELPENKLISLLREDIRREISKENGVASGGGDFHSPFWSDAKHFASFGVDLRLSTANRVAANHRRKRLYPPLCEGFLNWWDNKRRWRNVPLKAYETSVKGRYEFDELDAVVKVENLLGLTIGEQESRLIYPYLPEEPSLTDRNGQLGLWLLSSALPEHNSHDMRILDVMRSDACSITNTPLRGDEEEIFTYKYKQIIEKWDNLKEEY